MAQHLLDTGGAGRRMPRRPTGARPCAHRHARPPRHSRWRWVLIAAGSLAVAAVIGPAAVLWHQGYRMYVVHTGSMAPTYPPGTLVIDRPPSASYRIGEVITFRHSDLTTDVVTHRVVGVTAAGIHTKGDANSTADPWTIRPDQVQGQTVVGARHAGYVAVYFQQPAGIASIVTVLAGAMLLWGLFFPTAGAPDDSRRQPEATLEPAFR